MRMNIAIIVFLLPMAASAADDPQNGVAAGVAIERGLAFLAKDARDWKDAHHCISCHHAALTIWSMREAKQFGHKVDEPLLAELTTDLAESGSGKFGLQRPASAPQAASPKAIYFALALGIDPQPTVAVQKGLTLLLKTVKDEQTEQGFWSTWPGSRPPIFGSSDESLTALATLALVPVAASGDREATAARDRGVAWLMARKTDDDPQSIALRLVLWKRLNRPAQEWQPLVQRIKDRQNSDGGWSQTTELASDAWATGQSLYALACAGLQPNEVVLTRGRAFLIKAQRADGSWPMTSQPTAPGGKGSTSLIPITGAGSAWAVLGLVRTSVTAEQ